MERRTAGPAARSAGTVAPSSRRLVVTGGAGFIGANLCRSLCRHPGTEVVVVDDFSTGRADNLDDVDGVEVVIGSILDADLLADVVGGAEAVVHLAARPSVARSIEDPQATHDTNATGTLRVLEAARAAGNVHVVVASSSSVYGSNDVLPAHERLPVAPLSPYAASKVATEAYALAYQRSFDLPVTVFRFFNVFGPLQRADHAYAAVIPAFVSAALAGRPLPVHGDGSQTRDFTFVGSVTRVLEAAVTERVVAPGPINLAFGGRCSILELVRTLESVVGHPLTVVHGPSRAGDVHDSQADQRLLRSLFAAAEPVSLAEGLRQTVDWFRRSAEAMASVPPASAAS